MVEKFKCRKCGGPVTRPEGAGRPPSYCSVGCRRAAEYELRRAQTAVEAVEKDIRRHHEHLAIDRRMALACCGRAEAITRHMEWLEGERERLEGRMRLLLDEGNDND